MTGVLKKFSRGHGAERTLEDHSTEAEQVRAESIDVSKAVDRHMTPHADKGRPCGDQQSRAPMGEHPIAAGIERTEVGEGPKEAIYGKTPQDDCICDREHHRDCYAVPMV